MGSETGTGSDIYDVVVVGSGIGGVTAAALLAHAGQKVLVVEQGEGPGGYAHAFHYGPRTIDPAVHMIIDEDLFDRFLRYLGVRADCTFIPEHAMHKAVFPDREMLAPLTTREAFVDAHVQTFPDQESGIRRFFLEADKFHKEAHELPPSLPLAELDRRSQELPTFFKYYRATVRDVLEEHLSDYRARAACGIMSWLMGLPTSRLSFQTFAQTVYSFIDSGGFYSQGGAQRIIDAILTAYTRDGGTITYGSRVTRINVDQGHVTGIILEDGRCIRVPLVISNADVTQTMVDLVGLEHLPHQYVRRLQRLRPSFSAFLVFTGTTLPLARPQIEKLTWYSRSWDIDQAYEDQIAGRILAEVPGMGMFTPTLDDHTLAPEGEHLMTVQAVAAYDAVENWEETKERRMRAVIDDLDDRLPGFKKHMTFAFCATPITLQRYTLNHNGVVWGWEYAPDQAASKRPLHATPIEGLYLSGHWTQPGSGFVRACVSGIQTAQILCSSGVLGDRISTFVHPNVAPSA